MKRFARYAAAAAAAVMVAGCGPKPGPAPEAPPEAAPTVEDRLDAARAYMDEGRVGDAARLYEEVLAENAGSFEANLNLGLALITMEDGKHANERDYTEARKHLETAKALRSTDARPYFQLGMLDFAAGDYRGAIENLEVAVDLDPANERSHETLALALLEHGSAERARTELMRTVAINPDNAAANLELGKIYEREGRYETARVHLERALGAAPNLDEATYALERVYYNLGLHDRAEEACKRFLEYYPEDLQSLETLGNIYRSGGHTAEMIETYTRLTRIRPDNTTYWGPLIQHYMDVEDYGAAEKTLEAALEENPYYAYGNIRYGQVLLHYGDEAYDAGDKMEALQYYGGAKLHFEKAKIDDRFLETAFRLIDQANARIHKASAR